MKEGSPGTQKHKVSFLYDKHIFDFESLPQILPKTIEDFNNRQRFMIVMLLGSPS